MDDFRSVRPVRIAALAAAALVAFAPTAGMAQKFSVLYAFGAAPDGQTPHGALAQGQDGRLYGTTIDGGASGTGTVFSVDLSGKESALDSFSGSSGGINCNTGLSLGRDGNFYGSCPNGSPPYNFGTIFSAALGAPLTTLYAFSGPDGQDPEVGAPVQGSDGNFYGVTSAGGTNNGGTAFAISASSGLITLYNFGAFKGDAGVPSGALIQGADGDFYGTTMSGGKHGAGTVFRMTGTGQVTILHSFSSGSTKSGSTPMGGVVQAANGKLYGVTFAGGANNLGTVYTMSLTGNTQIIHSFSVADQSSSPCDTLALATDRNFYGTASGCVNGTCGTSIVFEVTAKGAFGVLHQFTPSTDGTSVSGPLYLDTNGTFYGTAGSGGPGGNGTIYSLNTGLAPFVSLSPSAGPVGTTVSIYGQGFSPSGMKVSFAGTQTKYTFLTANYIQAIVPTGAVTGQVSVKSSAGKLKSLQTFTVTSHRSASLHRAVKWSSAKPLRRTAQLMPARR
jgi:uncharacterized repeat protein (TIGR03803 family)